jgi:hypothetical protein
MNHQQGTDTLENPWKGPDVFAQSHEVKLMSVTCWRNLVSTRPPHPIPHVVTKNDPTRSTPARMLIALICASDQHILTAEKRRKATMNAT